MMQKTNLFCNIKISNYLFAEIELFLIEIGSFDTLMSEPTKFC